MQTVAPTQTVAQQAPVVASLPLNPATTLLPSVQPNPLLPTTQSLVPTMDSFQQQPLLTPQPIGGVPPTTMQTLNPLALATTNPLNPQNTLPAIADPTQTILAQLAMFKDSNNKLLLMLTEQSEQLTKLTANNACGCGSGGGTCGCTTKPEAAQKPKTETKPNKAAVDKDKTADKTNKK